MFLPWYVFDCDHQSMQRLALLMLIKLLYIYIQLLMLDKVEPTINFILCSSSNKTLQVYGENKKAGLA
ncbi:hypothetical protein L5515_019506 [Caenorhabditis briggsae]|uniref:Uncharacterized protein n=1 Tax=Caenorhabditis briggsae TaxID=6238 RepID=A0AAE9JTX9_CAEBR|nr:hypothetical protein L5515_019506 [Caenorhabditis briggsae]